MRQILARVHCTHCALHSGGPRMAMLERERGAASCEEWLRAIL